MTNPFIPSGSDAAMVLLWKIFGNVMNNMASSPINSGGAQVTDASTMLSSAFRYFDSGVLLFGTLILTAVTIFGVLNSANDGEVLGKTWSTFYTPVRTVAAAGSLIPAASGYAPVQIMLLYVVAWSVGFASNLWTNVVSVTIANDVTQSALNSVKDDSNFNNAISQAIRMNVCAQAMNKAMQSLGLPTKLAYQSVTTNGTYVATKSTQTRIYFADPNSPGSDALCGSITLSDQQPVISQTLLNGVVQTIWTASTMQTLRNDLATARLSFYNQMFSQYGIAAQEASSIMTSVDQNATMSAGSLATQMAQYKTQLTTNIQDQVRTALSSQTTQALAEQLTSQGWTMAGSYWNNLAQIKDFVQTSSDSKLTVSSPDAAGRQSFFGSGDVLNSVVTVTTPYEVMAAELTQQAINNPASGGTNSSTPTPPSLQSDFTLNDFTAGGTTGRQSFEQLFNNIPMWFVQGIVHALGQPDDPVMRVKNVGDSITTITNLLFMWKSTTVSVLSGLQATAQNGTILGTNIGAPVAGMLKGIITFIAEIFAYVKPSLFTLMYLGYWMGIWLPMVPFYVFAIGVVGWLVFVVEMMAAGMLWAAAHTTPARDNSFIGGQMQGYMLVMSGFFRPALMVLGLVASNAILGPAVDFINLAFLAKFQSMTQNSITMLTSVAGYVLGYVFILTSTFTLVFGLPQTLPDRVLRWIGAGIGDLGEQNTMGRIESAASSQSRTAMSQGMNRANAMDSAKRDEAAKGERSAASEGQRGIEERRHGDILEALGAHREAQTMTDTGEGADISKGNAAPIDP
jgi:conjugal transfer/type IV secretion protein DotA/TraY